MTSTALPISVEKFKELFVNRDDVYSVQSSKGEYFLVQRPLSDQTIKDHLLGKQTIGLYHLKNNLIKWALIDIDVNKEVWEKPDFKIEDWKVRISKQSEKVQEILKAKNIQYYREISGFKGEHVWIFFDAPVEAQVVKSVLFGLFRHMEIVDPQMHYEIFPKQGYIPDNGYGSLVKAPLGKHQKSGKFSSFIDIESFDKITFVTEKTLRAAINEYDAIFEGCSALRQLRDEAIHSEHLTHTGRLSLSYIFGNLGPGGIDYIIEEVYSKLNDYDADKTRKYVENIVDKKYKPITCKTLQDYGICPGMCAAIGNNKSPIAFYARQLGKKPLEDEIKYTSKIESLKVHGHCYYDYKDSVPEQISNFILNLYEQVYIDDGQTAKTVFRGHAINEDGAHDIEISADELASAEKFTSKIYSILGNSGVYIGDINKIRLASNKFSQKNRVTIKKIFGYNDNFTKYYTPSTLITADKICPNEELIIDLEGEASAAHLDMIIINDAQYKEVSAHVKEDLLKLADFGPTHASLAHTFVAIVAPFLDEDKSKYGLFLRGQSGTGKSFLFRGFQHFYGNFVEEIPTWTGTPYSIQRQGYFFKDALYLVDDYKMSAAEKDPSGVINVLQSYADNTGRTRLTSSGTAMAKTFPIKGFMAITAEDIIKHESSSLARMLTIEYTGKEKDIERGERVKNYRKFYCGITPRYIQHILQQDKQKLQDTRIKYQKEFYRLAKGQANDVRIARNVAILMTSYHYFAEFFWDKKEAEINIKNLNTYLKTTLQDILGTVEEEKSATRFWDSLQEYVASGKLYIAPDPNISVPESKVGATIGFKSGDKVWLIKSLAYSEVQRILKQSGEPLRHTPNAIFHDLMSDGIISSVDTKVKKFNGRSVRVLEANFIEPNLIDD